MKALSPISTIIWFIFALTTEEILVAAECENDIDYHWNEEPVKTCKWIRNMESRREYYCLFQEVNLSCPQTCGLCCEDSTTYTFTTTGDIPKDCAWIAKKPADRIQWCDIFLSGRMARDACPVTCDLCQTTIAAEDIPSQRPSNPQPSELPSGKPSKRPSREPSELPSDIPTGVPSKRPSREPSELPSEIPSAAPIDLPTKEPSIVATPNPVETPVTAPVVAPVIAPTITCTNDPTFRFQNRQKITCKWVRYLEKRRKEYCVNDKVSSACPLTCGVCCADDPDYKFRNKRRVRKNCKWLSGSQNRATRYCDTRKNGQMVRNACTETCDFCKTLIN